MLPGQTHGPLVAVVGGSIVLRSHDGKKFALIHRYAGRLLAIVYGKAQAMERAGELDGDDANPPPSGDRPRAA